FIKRIIEDSISYVYIFLMILLMPVTFYSQTYGWLAGFANYNTSTFFLLWILWLVNRKEFHSSTIIGIFILSIITQLFSENVTIASLVLSWTGILFALLNKEKIHTYLSWFAGAILGALIMFSNNAYHMQ